MVSSSRNMTFVTRDGQAHSNPVTTDAMQEKVVLVMDLVESVRLMAGDEAGTVERWRAFLDHARNEVLPPLRGRMVKSLGDGFLAEFDTASEAVKAALTLQHFFTPINKKLDASSRMYMRAGLNATRLYVDKQDVFGHGVNLAARVTTLGEPGQTVITSDVRDAIVEGLDCETEDMGESYLKHWPEPVRTWRAWPVSAGTSAGTKRTLMPASQQDLRPTVAVIPMEFRGGDAAHSVVGELIADGVIAQLSRNGQMRVISRLSTTAFRNRNAPLTDIREQLGADFVLSGSYSTIGDKVVLFVELCDARKSDVVWADRLNGSISDLLSADSELVGVLTDHCSDALLESTVKRSLILPVPQLDSSALMVGGIALMHRSTARDMDRSKELLEAVTDRHRRVATPWAWLAKWHVLNVVQGRSANAPDEFKFAIDLADRALDLEPHSALAMAIKGHVKCHVGSDLDNSRDLLMQATEVEPNNHTAWLYAGFWSTMWGDPTTAVLESEKALALSPLDPQRFFIEMLVAHSYLMANELPMAIDMCKRSLRRNRYYLATLRVLMTAQYESGLTEDAAATFATLKALQPNLTINSFLSYGQNSPVRVRVAKTMEQLGLG